MSWGQELVRLWAGDQGNVFVQVALNRMSEDGSEQRALAGRKLVSALAGISGDAQDADVLAARELI